MELTHIDSHGRARMVDVGEKPVTKRTAVARGAVRMEKTTLELIASGKAPKGDVLATARIAGIMAAKNTAYLIPLCHPLNISSIEVRLRINHDESLVEIEAEAKLSGQTGVEMEALTAVSVAALAIYDMCKAVDKGMTIDGVRLIQKEGGKSGTFVRKGEQIW